jgi:hypothetical protein
MPSCCLRPGAISSVEPRKTVRVDDAAAHLDEIIGRLVADPLQPPEARTGAPVVAGLYAWWAPPAVLPDLAGPMHQRLPDLRLLYVGIATRLRSRLASNHLRRSGSSTLRRTLAGLLLDDERLRTRWTDRVVLVDDDEIRLTEWMTDKPASLVVRAHRATRRRTSHHSKAAPAPQCRPYERAERRSHQDRRAPVLRERGCSPELN